jgi:hypothetical protein
MVLMAVVAAWSMTRSRPSPGHGHIRTPEEEKYNIAFSKKFEKENWNYWFWNVPAWGLSMILCPSAFISGMLWLIYAVSVPSCRDSQYCSDNKLDEEINARIVSMSIFLVSFGCLCTMVPYCFYQTSKAYTAYRLAVRKFRDSDYDIYGNLKQWKVNLKNLKEAKEANVHAVKENVVKETKEDRPDFSQVISQVHHKPQTSAHIINILPEKTNHEPGKLIWHT